MKVSYFKDIEILNIHDAKEISISPVRTSETTGTPYRKIKIDKFVLNVFFNDDSDCLITLENENE